MLCSRLAISDSVSRRFALRETVAVRMADATSQVYVNAVPNRPCSGTFLLKTGLRS